MSFPTTPCSHRRARNRTMKALLATAAVALSSALATTGAQADPPPAGERAGQDETISVKGGYAKFHHHGEIVEVSDEVLDGRGLQAELLVGGTPGHVSDFTADGDPERLNLSLREGRSVSLQLCYTVDHQRDECSRWQTGYA
jgi:hypothetical protein